MTKLTYLDDTYQFEATAKIVDLRENERGKAVILDATIFYPQGGGQPADQGEITSGDNTFAVSDVRLDEDGTVWHFGEFTSGDLKSGDEVSLKVDQERRTLHAKLHSAGHLLDCAVKEMNLDSLKPTKGHHFPDGPYVQYDGTVENGTELIPELEKTINDLITRNLKLERTTLSPEEAKERGVWAPPGKPARTVNFEGYPDCGCGGTHVNSSSEIGKVVIRKMKSKKGVTRIAYSVE